MSPRMLGRDPASHGGHSPSRPYLRRAPRTHLCCARGQYHLADSPDQRAGLPFSFLVIPDQVEDGFLRVRVFRKVLVEEVEFLRILALKLCGYAYPFVKRFGYGHDVDVRGFCLL